MFPRDWISRVLLAALLASEVSSYRLDTIQRNTDAVSTLSKKSTKLEAFQVTPPVLIVDHSSGDLIATNAAPNETVEVVQPSVNKPCAQTLVVYSFANSLTQPYVGNYTPPECSFNQVTWNLTVVVEAGIQYDRQGIVSFGNVELFRTTTSEPVSRSVPTSWTYIRDMTPYLSLFHENNTLIFDLANVIGDGVTSAFNVTLTASYFTIKSSYEPADNIFPIEKNLGSQGQSSYFTFPQENATSTFVLPRNIKRAVYTAVAVGQADEEFWWDSKAPFREVQLLIDGQLAGVAWPSELLFTGADNPSYWFPVVGIDAYDLPEYQIDITPWLPLLCNGKAHTFDMLVSGLSKTGHGTTANLTGTTPDDWYLGGKIFVWLDKAGHVTTGNGPHQTAPSPKFEIISKGTTTHVETTKAERQLIFNSTINLSTGPEEVFWSQSLNFTSQYTSANVALLTEGYEVSSSGYGRKFSYPFTYSSGNGFESFSHGKTVYVLGPSVFPTGLDTFYADTSGIGSSYVISQNVSSNGGLVASQTNGTLSSFSYSHPPTLKSLPPLQRTQKLFEQAANANDGILSLNINEFLVKPRTN